MVMLDKEELLFERDGKGEIIPRVVEIESLPNKPSIKILPLTRGEIKAIRAGLSPSGETTEDQDSKIIEQKVLEPKLSYEELVKFGKSGYIDKIVLTILKYSSLMVDTTPKKAIENAEAEIKKN
mgnify:FL=1